MLRWLRHELSYGQLQRRYTRCGYATGEASATTAPSNSSKLQCTSMQRGNATSWANLDNGSGRRLNTIPPASPHGQRARGDVVASARRRPARL